MNDYEILQYALINGIINLESVQEQIEMNERKKYLELHSSRIWKSTDGNWYTYLPDDEKGKRLIKRNSEKALEDTVVKYYQEKEEEPTVQEMFYTWINRKLEFGEIQRQTYDKYMCDYGRFLLGTDISNTKIKYIHPNDLEDYIYKTIKDNSLTSKAWANLRTLLLGTFKFARRRGYSEFNIIEFLNNLDFSKNMFQHNIKKASDEVFNQKEMQMITEYCMNKPTLANMAVLLATYTGMRVGEVVALKWEDVSKDSIYVHRTQITYKDENGKYVHTIRDFPKTEAGVRDVVIIPQLRPVLKKIRMMNPFTEYLFQNGTSSVILKNTLGKNLHIICDNLNIQRRGMHTLRRTFITNMINSNVEEAIILETVGHTDIATSKGHYYYNDKLLEVMTRQVSDAINY